MRKNILETISDYSSRMEGYGMLLCYKYMNLCVKAEPVALLPVTVSYDGSTYDFEKVAKVTITDWNKMEVFADDTDMNLSIQQGILLAHPEFKQEKHAYEYKSEDVTPDENDYSIILTMPEVNDDRYDLLVNGVKGLYEECSLLFDKLVIKCTNELTKNLSDPDEIKQAKDLLQQHYDNQKVRISQYRDVKLKEIEEAHDKYLLTHAEEVKKAQEKHDAENLDVTTTFNPGSSVND